MRRILYPFAVLLLFTSLFISCNKTDNYPDTQAVFSLQDASGNCLGVTVHGTYSSTALLTGDNYLEVQVNVAVAGPYDILTNTVDGFSFHGKGTLTGTGIQTIRLSATGKPLEDGDFTFETYYNRVGCSVDVRVAPPAPPAEYTIENTAGDCPSIQVNGIYMQTIPTDSTNSAAMNVQVTTAGSYTIKTETVNGIYFSATGVFANTGTQHVVLKAYGTPTSTGDISLTFPDSNCSVPVSIQALSNDPAVYSISCASTQLSGSYEVDKAVTANEKITVYLTITTPGIYTLSTPTVDGISFYAHGRFTGTSATPVPVVLQASGTPTSKGDFTATINGDGGTTCDVPLTVNGPAVFTLSGTPDACSEAIPAGDYISASPLTSANTVTIQANVTATGAYSIATSTANGMQFSATGTFTTTGVQDVVLTGSGTPTAAGDFSFTPQANGAGCSFTITVQQAQVQDGVYTCKIDGAFTAFNYNASASTAPVLGVTQLFLDGHTGPSNGGNVPELQIFIINNDGSAVQPGTYNEKGTLQYRIEVDYFEVTNSGVTIWNTSSNLLSTNPPFTINVTEVTATRVKGTFSGKLTNVFQGSTQTKTVTEGTFDLPIQ